MNKQMQNKISWKSTVYKNETYVLDENIRKFHEDKDVIIQYLFNN
jgi:hypothetical protein